tara:strand:- start:758 stop:907 length:150 start_codon:yes stop_codon:yes gene_type:complete
LFFQWILLTPLKAFLYRLVSLYSIGELRDNSANLLGLPPHFSDRIHTVT